MKKMMKMLLPVFLMSAAVVFYASSTAQEPRPDEQAQAVLDQLSQDAVVAIGAKRGPMGLGYLKNNGSTFTFVKGNSFEDKPEFKYQMVRQGNLIGIKSMVSGKLLRSSKNMGLKMVFDAADMSSPETQFVLWTPSKNQTNLSPIWLYNKATQGFISVRGRPDEVVTYDHTHTGAQHAPWEELFMELKSGAPVIAPAVQTGPSKEDLKNAHNELKALKEEVKKLRAQVDSLTKELEQATKKKAISDEMTGKIKVCDLEKAALIKKIEEARKDREALQIKLLEALTQLQALVERVKQGEKLTVQAILKTAPMAAAPIAAVVPVAPKAATEVSKQAAKKKKAKKAGKKKGKKKGKKAGKKKAKSTGKKKTKGKGKKKKNKKGGIKKSKKKKKKAKK